VTRHYGLTCPEQTSTNIRLQARNFYATYSPSLHHITLTGVVHIGPSGADGRRCRMATTRG